MSRAARDSISSLRLFTDGAERRVYEDAQGRQYVVDEEGRRLEGVWLVPAYEAVAVCSGEVLPHLYTSRG
jgi:hypothetical protein